jgi:hypothetical protein
MQVGLCYCNGVFLRSAPLLIILQLGRSKKH